MANQIQGGRKPLSQKPRTTPKYNINDVFRDRFSLDDDLKKEIGSKGLEYRWINYKKYVENGNYHEWGWAVYKREKAADTASFLLGNTPDGIIRRGDSVLAVRAKDICEKHRAHIRNKTEILSNRNFARQKASELRQMARESNMDITVHEGYEHEGEKEELGE